MALPSGGGEDLCVVVALCQDIGRAVTCRVQGARGNDTTASFSFICPALRMEPQLMIGLGTPFDRALLAIYSVTCNITTCNKQLARERHFQHWRGSSVHGRRSRPVLLARRTPATLPSMARCWYRWCGGGGRGGEGGGKGGSARGGGRWKPRRAWLSSSMLG